MLTVSERLSPSGSPVLTVEVKRKFLSNQFSEAQLDDTIHILFPLAYQRLVSKERHYKFLGFTIFGFGAITGLVTALFILGAR